MKNLQKTIKTTVFTGFFCAGQFALFDYTHLVDFHLEMFIFNFFFFGGIMGWIAYFNLTRPKKK